MKYTKTKNIEIGDIVQCLTNDGYQSGEVKKLNNDSIIVFMEYLQKEKEFPIKFIKF